MNHVLKTPIEQLVTKATSSGPGTGFMQTQSVITITQPLAPGAQVLASPLSVSGTFFGNLADILSTPKVQGEILVGGNANGNPPTRMITASTDTLTPIQNQQGAYSWTITFAGYPAANGTDVNLPVLLCVRVITRDCGTLEQRLPISHNGGSSGSASPISFSDIVLSRDFVLRGTVGGDFTNLSATFGSVFFDSSSRSFALASNVASGTHPSGDETLTFTASGGSTSSVPEDFPVAIKFDSTRPNAIPVPNLSNNSAYFNLSYNKLMGSSATKGENYRLNKLDNTPVTITVTATTSSDPTNKTTVRITPQNPLTTGQYILTINPTGVTDPVSDVTGNLLDPTPTNSLITVNA